MTHEILKVDQIMSGDTLVGFELTIAQTGLRALVFADQKEMPGIRIGDYFYSTWGETLAVGHSASFPTQSWRPIETCQPGDMVNLLLASGVETVGELVAKTESRDAGWIVDITDQPETDEAHKQWRAEPTHWRPRL